MSMANVGPQASVAFFDVDKTITRADTFLLLLRTALQEAPWRVILFFPLCPVFIATAILRLEKRHAKGAALWICTVGRGARGAEAWLASRIAARAGALWLPEAERELRKLEAAGHTLVFVTASAPEWITPLLEARGFGSNVLIGTRLQRFAGGYVLCGLNCYGNEKVLRIEERLGLGFTWALGYSDSYADAPMLARCGKRVLVSPTRAHLAAYEALLGAKGFERVGWREERRGT